MAMHRKWHHYQDFLDVLDTMKENRVSNHLFDYELGQEH